MKKQSAPATSVLQQRWYVLALLTFVYALSIADRYVMSTLIEPIKAELRLTDSAIGFLTGVALAIFYVTAGLPLASIADRANRKIMVALALGAWSLMTALSGMSTNFWQLMLARVGVGVGEAGGTPPSNSMLSDYFPWYQRPLALSIYAIGASIGSMVGSCSGYVSDAWGWRAAFLVLGIPGIGIAILVWLTVKEPVRGRLDECEAATGANLLDTVRYVLSQPALFHALVGAGVFTLWAWGLMWWTPSYLVRSFHANLGDAGGALSLMHGMGGTTVLLATTLLMARLEKGDPARVPLFVAITIAVATTPSILAYTTSSEGFALKMMWIYIPLSYATMGPTFALIQNLVPATMRAQAVALLLFLANLANLVVAPQLIGVASDLLSRSHGPEALRHALIPLAFTGFWAVLHYWRCAVHLKAGMRCAGFSYAPKN